MVIDMKQVNLMLVSGKHGRFLLHFLSSLKTVLVETQSIGDRVLDYTKYHMTATYQLVGSLNSC